MSKRINMSSLFLAAVYMFAALGSSCDNERKLSENPNIPFNRYETDLYFHSVKLNETIKYSVYLPAEYNNEKEKRYPVVYLLHGLGDSHQSWNGTYLKISDIVTQLEKTDAFGPMIYVMPQGFKTYYVNKYDGSYPYMDMFVEELVPHIDNGFRTIADRGHRAVAGYSMGGYGAMILPSKHPEVFSVSVPLSMSFRTDQQYMTESGNGWNSQWGSVFGGVGESEEARLTDYYKEHCPFYMFTETTAQDYSGISYFIDCGDDEEQLLVANDDLHVLMRDLDMPHEYRVRNGGHKTSYWHSGMLEALPYMESCFDEKAYPAEESVEIPGSHTAVKESKTLASVPAEIYLPEEYASNPGKKYSVVYYFHNGDGFLPPDDAMKILDNPTSTRKFILAACNAASLTGLTGVDAFMSAVEGEYRVFDTDATCRVGIGYDTGGKLLYEASLSDNYPAAYVYLIDAAIDKNIGTPNPAVYYYISLGDMGNHYEGANALYKYCHKENLNFEYRVHNGLPASAMSNRAILTAMRSNVIHRIKTN